MEKTKPCAIANRAVWTASQRGQVNRGAAGIDRQSRSDFAQELPHNLYKLWNRLASGRYFPPPVLVVEIRRLGAQQCLTGARPAVAERTLAAQRRRRGGEKRGFIFLIRLQMLEVLAASRGVADVPGPHLSKIVQ